MPDMTDFEAEVLDELRRIRESAELPRVGHVGTSIPR